MPFIEIASVQNGKAYSSESFSDSGEIRIAKIGDVANRRDVDFWENLERKEFVAQNGQLLSSNDILITLTGDPPDVGKVAIIRERTKECCTWNQRVARIKRKNNYYISNFVLYAVLSSEICRVQMERYAKGIRQRNLGNDCFTYVRLPRLSPTLQKTIHTVALQAKQNIEKAELCYKASENILKKCFEICDFTQNYSHAVKSLSHSFIQSGRLDAEYYQPKYDLLFETLSKFTTANLGGKDGLVSIKKSIEPGSEAYQDEGIPFVRVSDINQYGIVAPAIKLSPTIIPDIENLYLCKDTILLSKDGSVGIAYKVQEDMQVVTSSALLHLTVKDTNRILPDYLTLVLNSQVVQLQAERDCNGAIIQHWKVSDIEKVRIPILEMDKQKEISDKVQESFRLRKEAKRLLDNAIKAVEMAIETNEETALKLLKF